MNTAIPIELEQGPEIEHLEDNVTPKFSLVVTRAILGFNGYSVFSAPT